MEKICVYIKCDRNVEVQSQDVYLKDLGSLQCQDKEIAEKLKSIKVYQFQKGKSKRCVLSTLKLVALMEKECSDILVEIIGEPDVLVEWVDVNKHKSAKQGWKILMVCLVSFFGTAFTIMAYHNDIGINDIFAQIYQFTMNREPEGINILEVAYSVGLALGIIVFFNHVGGRRITKDPTPIEVAMRNYEQDVDKTLIETAGREGLEENP